MADRVSELEERVSNLEAMVMQLSTELQVKANISYVDDAVGKAKDGSEEK